MKNEAGAKPLKKNCIKPIDNKKKGLCPCNAFLRCSGRRPYGESIWADPRRRPDALKGFAYDGKGPAPNQGYYLEKFKYMLNSQKPGKKYNDFFKGIESLVEKGKMVVAFPEITDAEVTLQMSSLKVHNAALFSDFERSMVARANMVKNNLVMKSDVYLDEKGRVEYGEKQLIPFSKQYDDEWTVDHILPKSKGGCNRFCNAAMMCWSDNVKGKNDIGLGCPCVSYIENKADLVKDQQEFKHDGEPVSAGKLFECTTLQANKNDKTEKLPAKPPGMIKKYKDICGLDDPRIHIASRGKVAKNKVKKICN